MEARTGISAEISRDGKKLILIQDQGEDIVLRKTTHKIYGKHVFVGWRDFVFLKSSAAKKNKKK